MSESGSGIGSINNQFPHAVPPAGGLDIASLLIQHFEGRRLAPYQDIRGIWTIGNGNTTGLDGHPITAETPALTDEQCDELRERTIQAQADRIAPHVQRFLSYHEWGALLSLAWNIGAGAFLGSTLLQLINCGMMASATRHFVDWCHVDGKLCQPLLMRRRAEAAVFATHDTAPALVPHLASVMVPKPAETTTDQLNAASLAAAEKENT